MESIVEIAQLVIRSYEWSGHLQAIMGDRVATRFFRSPLAWDPKQLLNEIKNVTCKVQSCPGGDARPGYYKAADGVPDNTFTR
jgi:hypothetical protein